jgi:uncharacterized CHY-type Zn-finger protein
MSSNVLRVPSAEEIRKITRAFVKDLESYTVVDERSNTIKPVICCVCDSIPTTPNWSCMVKVSKAAKLFSRCNMESSKQSKLYPQRLLDQYSISMEPLLAPYVLSPHSYVNEKKKVMMCHGCHDELVNSAKQRNSQDRFPPKQAIASGYVIGEAPVQLESLNEVELSMISNVRTYCQSWTFFGGCHQHIKGWHTFFRNRPTSNVGNLMQLADAGMQGIILVVMCGPFTSTQNAMVRQKTAVNPLKVIAAWNWLKANNFRYHDAEIPNIDDIPTPVYLNEVK